MHVYISTLTACMVECGEVRFGKDGVGCLGRRRVEKFLLRVPRLRHYRSNKALAQDAGTFTVPSIPITICRGMDGSPSIACRLRLKIECVCKAMCNPSKEERSRDPTQRVCQCRVRWWTSSHTPQGWWVNRGQGCSLRNRLGHITNQARPSGQVPERAY